MNRKIYTRDELEGLSDNEILRILAESWGIEEGDKFEVWGELPALENEFGFLQEPRLVKTGEKLYYPLHGEEHKVCTFFVNSKDSRRLGYKEKRSFIRCELELSPKSERNKHKNPFSLCVKKGKGEKLRKLPKSVPNEILIENINEDDRNLFISKIIYDFFLEKEMKGINLEVESGLANITEIKNRKNELEGKVLDLHEKHKILNDSIELLIESKRVKELEFEQVIQQYIQMENNMNNRIKKLRSYIADKADFLSKFEFLDKEDIEKFLIESKSNSNNVDGVLFDDLFNSNYESAVSYIQSYLINKDILYPRHIIENYLTLLRTKDLIILAGDSGSGKTNLVKSFAEAVGGKSIIIPVKPNWTSSEDLLGYYNPLEKKFLATPFLEALIEAQQNPEIPYFICLDEMNLARVEYYFADFLSLLETRHEEPEITLYATDESSHILSELKAVVEIIQAAKEKYKQNGIVNFIELLKDERLNSQLRLAFGFSDKDSLIKYHGEIRRMLSTIVSMPSSIKMPTNVHIIGAINIDETTHYLSPKILDRAHIMRFKSPLLLDWEDILQEVKDYSFEDVSKPLIFSVEALGYRSNYPRFERNNPFCELFIELNKEFFQYLGIEFGMRTIRQGLNYLKLFKDVNKDNDIAINNFILHKVLPKFTFDGNKLIGDQNKLEIIERVFIERIKKQLPNYKDYDEVFSVIVALENIVKNAKSNDGIVNFWS